MTRGIGVKRGTGIAVYAWVCIAAAGLMLWPGAVRGGLLADCEDAIPSWHGTVSSSYTYDTVVLSIDLDYAVFAAGDYIGLDPSAGVDYVYAYQIFNLDPSTVGVTALSVGLRAGSEAGNMGYDPADPPDADEVPPDLSVIGTSSAHWAFGWISGSEIDPDGHSAVLVFTSPNEPGWNSSTTTDGGLPVPSGSLPSPIPEPATLGLLAAGALLALARRRHRRQ